MTIPNSVTRVGYSAFNGCLSLTSISLPFVGETRSSTERTHIGYIFGAGSYNYNNTYVPSSLKTVIVTGATRIGADAFYNCASITSVVLNDGITKIEEYAFYNCAVESLTIPNILTKISVKAFENCSKLTKINYTGTIDEWATFGLGVFFYNQYKLFINGDLVTKVQLTTATTICDYAFNNCISITSVDISNSVTSIGAYVFKNCKNLKTVTIPLTVTRIVDYAFSGCPSLTICCEADCQLSGWANLWNYDNLPVVWAYKDYPVVWG